MADDKRQDAEPASAPDTDKTENRTGLGQGSAPDGSASADDLEAAEAAG